MKISLLGIIVLIFFSSFFAGSQEALPITKNNSFTAGEELGYRVNFGIFTVGSAVTRIDLKVYTVNKRPCYKIDAWGETSPWISWITKVKDNWGAYLDTVTLNSQMAYRKIREGRYKKDEVTQYDHVNHTAEVQVMNQETKEFKTVNEYKIPKDAKDLVSGFMLLRVIDFKRVSVGDTLQIDGFFEDSSYNLKIMYKGRENVKTKIGTIPCFKLVPIMPDNKLFDGENSITCWISDDKNKIPVKIQAKMFIGHTGIELESFRGLRNQLRIVR